MTPAERLELAEAASANVIAAISFLERPSPASLDRSAAELSVAIGRVQELQCDFARELVACDSKAILLRLRKDLRRASRLLGAAWEFQVGCGLQSEYSEKGELRHRPVSMVRLALEA